MGLGFLRGQITALLKCSRTREKQWKQEVTQNVKREPTLFIPVGSG